MTLSTLVTSTFVIEKQPPQQAQLLLKSETQAGKGKQPVECGEILNNSGAMEYQPTSRQLCVSFRNMQLRKIKRAEKKGTESVMDEKLTLLFQSQFNVGGGELVFQHGACSYKKKGIQSVMDEKLTLLFQSQFNVGGGELVFQATVTWDNAFSAPGRVPFHVPDKATVTWDNAFSAPGRVPFHVPDKEHTSYWLMILTRNSKKYKKKIRDQFYLWFQVTWGLLAETLRIKFCSATGGDLSEENLRFLAEKIFRFLQGRAPGTQLHLLGVVLHGRQEGNEVFSLQPFTSRDLIQRSLADRVLDLPQLQFLYPNIAKDDVFSKF
ncbi:Signal transducer and activator of transcription short form [Operophtera brumata]|uniref:Signal transducer and activator of transcription short form n=1 Tax=Operophtera brumata TaxID=104452 RepID=A0A0L7L6M9_OPEBR|nr:Signal transducer and activator of transcription short form [Operophtera brumata]